MINTAPRWTTESTPAMPNMQILWLGDEPIGGVQKPKTKRGDKPLWRCWTGSVENCKTVGFDSNLLWARQKVENAVLGPQYTEILYKE